MADVTVNVLTPATSIDFLTLEEAKLLLGINAADNTQDDLLSFLISTFSAVIAKKVERTFARERVTETWREVFDGRLFLTHWPVRVSDIETVTSGGNGVAAGLYELEEQSGKLSNVLANDAQALAWPQSVIVTYTGGFDLPAEAPLPLKQAAAMLIREEKMRMIQAQVAGIRQVSHREARVTFFDPNSVLMRIGGQSPSMKAVDDLLSHYTRFWV
jgi:hypothetical protein